MNTYENTKLQRDLVSYLKDVADGLSCFHSRGICHADVKKNNMLVDETYMASICNFGYDQKPLLLIDYYGVPATCCPPEANHMIEGPAIVDGFQLDQYTLDIISIGNVHLRSLIRTVGQKDPLKFNWSLDAYPMLCLKLCKLLFQSFGWDRAHDVQNIIFFDAGCIKCAQISYMPCSVKESGSVWMLNVQALREKIKKSQEDEIWLK